MPKRRLLDDGRTSSDRSLDVTSSVSDWPKPLAVIIEYCGLGTLMILSDSDGVVGVLSSS